jgi:flagellar biosynthetic protein FliR
MVAIFFSNLAMAIVGKAVPQINVLITSLSINVAVGFIVMIVSLPLVVTQMESFLEVTTVKVFEFLKSF